MNAKPLLSIVVPTKDRYKYLKHLIELINSFQSNEIELIIQDNSACNLEILDFLNQKEFLNVKYFHKSKKIPISLNADNAILNSTGEYICFIGDDDGVCRNIIDCVKWMKRNDIEAVFSRSAYFSWGNKAKLIKSNNKIIKHDAKKEIIKLLKRGLILNKANVPLLYHGIVKREKLEEIYKIGNTFFGGPTPDISSAVNLSFVVENYYEINIPLIINGSSDMTGGGVVNKGGVLHLEDIPFISDKEKENWEKDIPLMWTGSYAWANSGIKSLRYSGKDDFIEVLNRDYYLAYAVAIRPKNKALLKYAFSYSSNNFLISYLIVKLMFLKHLRKLKNIDFKNIIRDNDVKTIVDAEDFFNKNSVNIFTHLK